jgi:DNA-binding CsgD family transcriptional regulator
VGIRRNGFDAIRAPHFAGQVLTGLVASSICFSIFDRQFRCQFVNEALAKINRIPVTDHIGECLRKITGEVAKTAEPILQAVFDTGKVISGFEITGKLPKRPDVGHWVATYFPIRDGRGRVKQVGILGTEIASQVPGEETVIGVNKQLLKGLTLNMDRTQELLLELRRLRGKYGLLRADSERIVDEIREAASDGGPRQEHGSASLSERETEILTFLAKGRSNKAIASTLNISVKTVETYRARIFWKLQLDSFASLVRYAIRTKMVEP